MARRIPRPREHVATGEGDPVVLVHGFACSSEWWRPTLPALTPRRRVLAPNLPGFAGSAALPGSFSLDALADWLAGWLEEQEAVPAAVVGHSMGGSIAVRLAAARPELVTGLVLVGSSGVPDRRPAPIQALAALAEGLRTRRDGKLVLAGDVVRAGPRTLLSATRPLARDDVRPLLAGIRVPVLLVWGRDDTLVPLPLARELAAALPDARLEILERSSHVPMWSEPAAFEALLTGFLDTIPPSRPAEGTGAG